MEQILKKDDIVVHVHLNSHDFTINSIDGNDAVTKYVVNGEDFYQTFPLDKLKLKVFEPNRMKGSFSKAMRNNR